MVRVKLGQVKLEQIKSGQVTLSWDRTSQVRTGQVHSRQVKLIWKMSNQVGTGQVQTGQVKLGKVKSDRASRKCFGSNNFGHKFYLGFKTCWYQIFLV